MATVTLSNLSGTLPDPKVAEVNLEIGDGEFVVLVGPRGSGKSTLLRLIAGLEEASQGEILIGDRKVNAVPPKDRDIAMVFREYALYPHMSAHENIAFWLKMRKFPQSEISKRVQDAAAILGIEPLLLPTKPASLSAEQRLRVALARTLVRQPKVFLFEDPLANLDPPMRAPMRIEIAKLHQRLQATMIFSTRDSDEAMALGDRLVVLRDGRVAQIGAPTAVYAAPTDLFVAGIIGNPPMNFIHGTLKPERDSWLFRETQEGTIELRLPADRAGAAEFAGKPIILGVRPEDIEMAPAAPGSRDTAGSFAALLEVIEPQSAGANLYLQTGAHALVSRSRNLIERGDAGRRRRFTIEAAKAHLFDPASTRRVA